jgi:hypothetical protein
MRTSSTVISHAQILTAVVISRFYSGELGPKHLNIKISNYAALLTIGTFTAGIIGRVAQNCGKVDPDT